jgi:putative transmembrane protein PGPGW
VVDAIENLITFCFKKEFNKIPICRRQGRPLKKQLFKIPHNKTHRLLLGWGLILGGIVGFLPVVGFWMLPLGISILAIDLPWARRLKRRFRVWWGRRQQKPVSKQPAQPNSEP